MVGADIFTTSAYYDRMLYRNEVFEWSMPATFVRGTVYLYDGFETRETIVDDADRVDHTKAATFWFRPEGSVGRCEVRYNQ